MVLLGRVCLCGYEVGRPRRAHVSIEHFGERVTVVTKTFVFDTKKPQSGRTEGAAIPVGAI